MHFIIIDYCIEGHFSFCTFHVVAFTFVVLMYANVFLLRVAALV